MAQNNWTATGFGNWPREDGQGGHFSLRGHLPCFSQSGPAAGASGSRPQRCIFSDNQRSVK